MCCIEYGRLRSNPLDTKSFDNNCEPLAERASGPLLRKLLVLRASKRCCAVELLIQAVSAAGAEQHHRQLGRAGPALAAHIDIVHQEARANPTQVRSRRAVDRSSTKPRIPVPMAKSMPSYSNSSRTYGTVLA
mmetsp:Transcript_69370/g.225231  ORF Transcript_69370/g.225231 Transcript_69370/m.225231 type:complete len:133 (-) Transcript_69370:1021-1419(-)